MIDIRDLGRAALAAAGLLVLAGATPAWAGTTERVSVGARGKQGDDGSSDPCDLGRRALRRLQLGRQQPRPG